MVGDAPSKEVLTLRQQVADLQAELELTLQVNAELTKQVEALAKYAPQATAAPVLSAATFEVDGVSYGFAMPAIMLKGRKITAALVAQDIDLQHQLVAMKSGMIKPV